MLIFVTLFGFAVHARVNLHGLGKLADRIVKGDCDCSWVTIPGACNNDDGSYCWSYCCKGPHPNPPPTPTPPPNPTPAGDWKPANLVEEYRRMESDLKESNGFARDGGMRYHSQTRYNLLGGGLKFTMDLSRVQDMVNANLYLVVPETLQGGHFYCDNSETFVNKGGACMELDIVESNGHSLTATTMHTKIGTNSGCDTWGCRQITNNYNINFNAPFDVNVNVANDGDIQVYFVQGSSSYCAFCGVGGFDGAAKAAIVDAMRNHGAVIVSSMWTGWVPPNNTGKGNLDGSHFEIHNVMYSGVAMGPTFTQHRLPSVVKVRSNDCDCSWITIPGACDHSDGSECWTECCGAGPTPGPPGPSPSGDWEPVPLVEEFRVGRLLKDRLGATDADNGFSRQGGMRYHSQKKYNLLGGGLKFTADLSGVNDLVNANLYLVIPGTLEFDQYYCDNSDGTVAKNEACIELDIMESNGHSLIASTMHTKLGHNSGCDTWGCRTITNNYSINFNAPFDVNVNVAMDGDIQVYLNQGGNSVCAFCGADGWDSAAKAAVVDGMSRHGAIVVSSMWTGWVPPNDTGTGDLDGSHYTVSNVMYSGSEMGPSE